MSDERVERLEALLTKVQTNRRQPNRTLIGAQAVPAQAAVAAPQEPPSSALRRPGQDRRVPAEEPDRRAEPERRPVAVEMPFKPEQPTPPPPPNARREPAAAPRAAQAPHEPAGAPIQPRVIDPDPPRASSRPIAQLVSKHIPAVDATFGAMLKRSLSLRPH